MDENKLDIEMKTGRDFVMSFTMYDDNNNVTDLSGSTVEANLRQESKSFDFFPFTMTHNGAGGRVKMAMSHEMTAEIPYSKGVYDVKVTFPDGFVAEPIHGEVYIETSAT